MSILKKIIAFLNKFLFFKIAVYVQVESSWPRHIITSFILFAVSVFTLNYLFHDNMRDTIIEAQLGTFIAGFVSEGISYYTRKRKGVIKDDDAYWQDLMRDTAANIIGIFFFGTILGWLLTLTTY